MKSPSHPLPKIYIDSPKQIQSYSGSRRIQRLTYSVFSRRLHLFIHSSSSFCHPRANLPVCTVSHSLRSSRRIYPCFNSIIKVTKCSCFGASLCYFLSYSLAKSLVLRKFPALFSKFHNMVNAHRQNLFWYMLFLRLTPLIPNWFVNLASPLVGMPYIYFLGATFFGIVLVI